MKTPQQILEEMKKDIEETKKARDGVLYDNEWSQLDLLNEAIDRISKECGWWYGYVPIDIAKIFDKYSNQISKYVSFHTPTGDHRLLAGTLHDMGEEVKKIDKGWISVNDRLPEQEGKYLIWIDTMKSVSQGQFYKANKKYTGDFKYVDRFRETHVTHWMPLPSSPNS